MLFSEETLYAKAKQYMQRAREASDSALFAFWALLALELLCRAAVAKVHPALVADPKNLDSLIYACGRPIGGAPKSAPISEILERCVKLVSRFEPGLKRKVMDMMEIRNAELHSGEAAFATMLQGAWQPDYFAVSILLLDHLGRPASDLFGEELAGRAEAMLRERHDATKTSVLERIARHRRAAEAMPPEEVAAKRLERSPRVEAFVNREGLAKQVECPSCGSPAVVAGQVTDRSEPKVGDGRIAVQAWVVPTAFRCLVCDLRLSTYAELEAAGFGEVYGVTEEEDPVDFFGIDPKDYIDASELIETYRDEYMDE